MVSRISRCNSSGGFDCILGNPPYLGGQALSGTYGYPFCSYLKWSYGPIGLSDLVVFFIRRIFGLLKQGGITAFITTNSIKDGDVRKDGIEQILRHGGEINMAVRAIRWPGRANVVVSLLAIYKGMFCGRRMLNGVEVSAINAFLEDSPDEGAAESLIDNAKRIFQGAIFLGDGFLLSNKEAEALCVEDFRNREVVFPSPRGKEDINNAPDQTPGRSIINFHDWSIEKAATYQSPFEIVRRRVQPVRATNNRSQYRDLWWIYAERRPGLVQALRALSRCFVVARTTKHLSFSAMPTTFTFTDSLYVFSTDRWDLYALVQSTLHEVWARKYSGALKQDLRYSPSDCFETFVFPEDLWQSPSAALASLGEQYHQHRKSLMPLFGLVSLTFTTYSIRVTFPLPKSPKSARSSAMKPNAATMHCSNSDASIANWT